MLFLKEFFEQVNFEKNEQTTEKVPSIQRVNSSVHTKSDKLFEAWLP